MYPVGVGIVGPTQPEHHIRLRLVAIWHPARKCHQPYLTNVSADQLAALDLPAIYAMRWEIELLFGELKSQLSIDQIPSGSKAAVDTLIYAGLLVLAIGRKLHRALQCRSKGLVDRFPLERWSSILRQVANDLLHILLAPTAQRHTLSRRLALLLRSDGKDPNRHRLLFKARAQLGVLAH
jgi:putative transposase